MRKVLTKRSGAALAALAWLVAFGSASGQPRLGNELVESPIVWRAFRPLVLALGEGDREKAVAYMRAGSAITRKAEASLERDEPTEAFRTKAIESLEDFDLKSFYGLLPEQNGPFRSFAFAGEAAAKSYRVRMAKGEGFEVHKTSSRRGFGDSSGVVRMRTVTTEDDGRYLLHLRGGLGLGALSWPAILSGIRDALGLLESELGQGTEDPLVLRAAESFLKKSQPELGARDRRVLAIAWGGFPEVSKLLVPLSRVEDLVDETPLEGGVTHAHLVSRWNVKGLAGSYPELASYFRDLEDIAEAKITLTDEHGNTLLTWQLDTEHMRSRLDAFVREGRLVPSRAGKPLLDQVPAYERMRASVDLHFVLHNVNLYVDGLNIDMKYREHATGAELALAAKQAPKIRVKGAAFGVLPTRVINWFIPGDIEGLARRLYEAAVTGNEGHGLAAITRFEGAPAGATLDGSLGAEVLDNALVRFAMAIIADRVVPDEQQEEDIKRLAVAYRDAFDADLERFAKYGR